jgi:TRAP-type C4-dicarboxylate transport system substrate-binding protein
MGFTYGGYHAGLIDIANIECGLPMSWANTAEAALFHLTYGFQDLAREAYAEKGVYWITPVFEVPFLLISKKPVRTLADLKGMKIRATAPVAAVLNQFDIPTVYLPSQEFYTSMATGVIDGIIYGSWYAYAGLKLQEQAKYVTDMKILYPMTSAIIVNKKVWEGLPADLRGTIGATAEAFYRIHYFTTRAKDDVEARKQFETFILPPDDVAKLTNAALKEWDKEAQKSPRAKKAIELLKSLARDSGRL